MTWLGILKAALIAAGNQAKAGVGFAVTRFENSLDGEFLLFTVRQSQPDFVTDLNAAQV